MAHEPKPIDIDDEPALLRLIEEVRASGEPRHLRIDEKVVAVVRPIPIAQEKSIAEPIREITEADWEAFRSSAGSWKDVDVDKFLEDVYVSRDASISTKAPGSA